MFLPTAMSAGSLPEKTFSCTNGSSGELFPADRPGRLMMFPRSVHQDCVSLVVQGPVQELRIDDVDCDIAAYHPGPELRRDRLCSRYNKTMSGRVPVGIGPVDIAGILCTEKPGPLA